MAAKQFVSETLRAMSRQGLAALCAVMMVIAGSTWGSQGLPTAAAVLCVGLAVGLAVLIVMARASIDSERR